MSEPARSASRFSAWDEAAPVVTFAPRVLASPDLLRMHVNARLDALLPAPCDEADLVCRAMRDCALAPGKRIRPLLMLLAADGLGCRAPALLDVACAVEMVHASSLILDDMPCMDNANLRRGRPTVHKRYGEDVAILASVALLSQAFQVLAEADAVPPERQAALVASLARAVGTQGLVRGQYKDLRDGARVCQTQEVAQTNELKTGVLFGAALDMAALVADADPSTRAQLHRFAIELGHAFQLLDDLRDSSDSAWTGKDGGKDAGKSTLLALLGIDEVRRRLAGHVAAADEVLTRVYGQHNPLGAYLRPFFAAA